MLSPSFTGIGLSYKSRNLVRTASEYSNIYLEKKMWFYTQSQLSAEDIEKDDNFDKDLESNDILYIFEQKMPKDLF